MRVGAGVVGELLQSGGQYASSVPDGDQVLRVVDRLAGAGAALRRA